MKKRRRSLLSSFLIFNFSFLLLSSCSIEKKIGKSVKTDVLDAKVLQTAHVGISIFDPAENKYWFNHQGDKYFVPASNIKIPTCYAAMKYLGDSLVGWATIESNDEIVIIPKGDPTFLHPDFKDQLFFQKLKATSKKLLVNIVQTDEFKKYGSGWSWNDYLESYMAERSRFCMYGNVATFERIGTKIIVTPNYFVKLADSGFRKNGYMHLILNNFFSGNFDVWRDEHQNSFWVVGNKNGLSRRKIPFITKSDVFDNVMIAMLLDTLKKKDSASTISYNAPEKEPGLKEIRTEPTDSLLKPMMHRSDNFFAEQTLLMVSEKLLGKMNDFRIIDTILKTDFKDLPQKPRWADGSGLSRYNLFTPQDFVAILNKMKNEFGMERLKVILPTGGEGTISSYYKADSGYIFGKTGTLSGVVAFSGFMYTKKGKLLIFSTLINNHQASATDVRRAIEKFLQGIRNRF